ncbi:MAG: preprotein translocase subunit SecG [Armatimonadota bacterium]|nr:preprotein translocase subunit SecG [Armatimonadota bacterium]
MGVVVTILTLIQLISAIALIGLVMTQTTKSEGLTGTIGGKMTSSFRGKPGMDEKLAGITKWCAIIFFVLSAVIYYVRSKMVM